MVFAIFNELVSIFKIATTTKKRIKSSEHYGHSSLSISCMYICASDGLQQFWKGALDMIIFWLHWVSWWNLLNNKRHCLRDVNCNSIWRDDETSLWGGLNHPGLVQTSPVDSSRHRQLVNYRAFENNVHSNGWAGRSRTKWMAVKHGYMDSLK